jgi:hypothetical protein
MALGHDEFVAFVLAISHQRYAPPPQEGDLCHSGQSAPVAEGAISPMHDRPSPNFGQQFKLLHGGIGLAEDHLQ